MTTWLRRFNRFARLHLIFLSVVALLSVAIYSIAILIHPFDPDNLIALSMGALDNPLSLVTGNIFGYLPATRPLAYLTIWLQYHWGGLNPMAFFTFNVAAIIGAAWSIYLLAYSLGATRTGALVSAVLFLSDPRLASAAFWIFERQTPLAIMFGAAALILIRIKVDQQWRIVKAIAIYLCLLASVLSKEYGLAFSAAGLVLLLLDSTSTGRQWYAGSIILVVASFLVYRFVAVDSSAIGNYCEEMGFFTTERVLCYGDTSFQERLIQYSYNIAATMIGTFFPRLFNFAGMLVTFTSSYDLLLEVLILVIAIVAAIKQRNVALAMLALLVANALLSFLVYRSRNHVVGMAGLYIAAGIGYTYLLRFAHRHSVIQTFVLNILLIYGLTAVGTRIVTVQRHLFVYQNVSETRNPCDALILRAESINIDVIKLLQQIYALGDLACTK